MSRKLKYRYLGVLVLAISVSACTPELTGRKSANTATPTSYYDSHDTMNVATVNWRDYFDDQHLIALIDTALQNNQELKLFLQEMEVVKNEVSARKGEYLPSVGLGVGAELEKVGRFTREGAIEAHNEIEPGREFPEPLPDFMVGAFANWEIDIWRKLRNSRKAAMTEYLSTAEGRNFMVTNLVAEIADAYYELLALDNQLDIVKRNIDIQRDALDIIYLQKQSARITELAVRRFEAQMLGTRSIQYEIKQQITETENHINFLLGRFPQPISRSLEAFEKQVPDVIHAGVPSQLLQNRPDIRQAELELMAAKLNVKVARANFYPSFGISAGVGFQAFNSELLLSTPESLMYSLAGDLVAPLINRKAIKAEYYTANARQIQAIVEYEQTILKAYIEVANQMASIDNMRESYQLRSQQVEALTESIKISDTLFKSARADYMEVLMTQRDALESKFELVETKRQQLGAYVKVYRALGGGWQ